MNIFFGTMCVLLAFLGIFGGTGTMEMSSSWSEFFYGLLIVNGGITCLLAGIYLINLDKPTWEE